MSASMASLKAQVLRFVADAPSKVDFARLKHHVKEKGPVTPKALKPVVAGLIQEGLLRYTYCYGHSFIELS